MTRTPCSRSYTRNAWVVDGRANTHTPFDTVMALVPPGQEVTVDGVEMCGFNHAVTTALLQTLPKYFECRRLKHLPEHLQALGPKRNKPGAADGRTKAVKRTAAEKAGAAGVGAEGAVTVFPEQVAKRARSADQVTITVANPPTLAPMAALEYNSAAAVAETVAPLPPPLVVDSTAATTSPLHLEATTVDPPVAIASLQTVAQQQDVSTIQEAQTQQPPQPLQ